MLVELSIYSLLNEVTQIYKLVFYFTPRTPSHKHLFGSVGMTISTRKFTLFIFSP
jgi:hypothetical protein